MRVMACVRLGASLVIMAAFLASDLVRAEAVPEYELKAAFLYNFAQLVGWPQERAASQGPFNLCVIGAEAFGAPLEALAGKAVRGKPLAVRRLAALPPDADCQMLFIGAAEEPRLAAILGALRERPVLTVADTPGWLERGVMINLVARQARLGFEVNLDAGRRAGLRISSRLLRLAVLVLGREAP